MEHAAGSLLTKGAVAGGAGVMGALVIAAVAPPKTRRELFLHAASAGVGSLTFGPLAVHILATLFPSMLSPVTIEVAVPIYFVVGSLSWGAFSALAQLRNIIATRGAEYIAKKAE